MTKSMKITPAEQSEGIMLLLDKPKEYTSAHIVNIVKKILNVKKAGHSGTLDPKATGLMIICTGKKTKSLNELLDSDKEYEGVMVIGEKTKSFDTETEVFETNSAEYVTKEMAAETAASLTGEIDQLPPMYSAIKHKGKPLYKMARKGEVLERSTRKVNIKKFEITGFTSPEITFRVLCSKGTYIRTLVSDFGNKLGCGAYLKELRRTKIGGYDISSSVTLADFIEQNKN